MEDDGAGWEASKLLDDEEARWDAEARKVREQLENMHGPMTRSSTSMASYRHMHCVWVHESGAKFFLGDVHSAQDAKILKEEGVSHILNCTANLPLYLDHDPYFSYYRMLITKCYTWSDNNATKDAMLPALLWVEEALSSGKSVLSHCLAGAHRSAVFCRYVLGSPTPDFSFISDALTSSSGYLYWKVKQDETWAFNIVKSRRPVSQPSLYVAAMDKVVKWVDSEGAVKRLEGK